MIFGTEKDFLKRDLLNRELELVDLGFDSDILILFPTYYQKNMSSVDLHCWNPG